MTEKLTGKLFLIVGPSGSGKGTVIKMLQNKFKGFVYPISYTTREPREREKDGESYHFITKEKFKQMIAEDDFLEYAVVHSDNYYGTAKTEIMNALRQGAVVIREVDIQGFHSIRKMIPKESLVSVFMKVPNLNDLKGRIEMRGAIEPEELQRRLDSAARELAQAGDCDYQVHNEWGKMKACVSDVEGIILEEIKGLY
ncbi:MAG: guanylate kinase [Candidatus Peregrinibacteria bacterium]|nr:guanylate kinase [Candidatus Peregrinibacteria bacterium]